jgi:hypothetical protein
VENLLVSRVAEIPAYRAFFDKDLPKVQHLRQFGEIAVIKNVPSIKGKLTDRGLTVMYLGRAVDHAPDTNRFLNLQTKRVLNSRDAIWLNKTYGEYNGTNNKQPTYETISVIDRQDPAGIQQAMQEQDDDDNNDDNDQPPPPPAADEGDNAVLAGRAVQARVDGPRTRSQGMAAPPVANANVTPQVYREMQRLAGFTNPTASTIADQVRALRSSHDQ